MKALIEKIEKAMGQKIKNPFYLETSLTHRSYINEFDRQDQQDNERLEFLGDSVLGAVVSQELMRKYPDQNEGVLSKYRSGLVNEKVLSQVAKSIELDQYLRLGKGEEKNAGREKPSILSDAFEALVAAIFLSNGFEGAQQFLLTLFSPWIEDIEEQSKVSDFKSQLQEHSLKVHKMTPKYVLVAQVGPDHHKTFETHVIVNNVLLGRGEGKSKKDSEQMAAQKALETIANEVSV